jgi:hypothetical protein
MPPHGPPGFTRALAGALAVTTLAAPVATARPATDWTDRSSTETTNAPAPTVTRTIDEGVDWGSAAIGAGAATGVLLLVVAGATGASHRHHHVRSIR